MRKKYPITRRMLTGMTRVWRCRFIQQRRAIHARSQPKYWALMLGWYP